MAKNQTKTEDIPAAAEEMIEGNEQVKKGMQVSLLGEALTMIENFKVTHGTDIPRGAAIDLDVIHGKLGELFDSLLPGVPIPELELEAALADDGTETKTEGEGEGA